MMETVEVEGLAPSGRWMESRTPHYATPICDGPAAKLGRRVTHYAFFMYPSSAPALRASVLMVGTRSRRPRR
jgi:hypothetical protein